MNTIDLVESLLFKNPKMRKAFIGLNIISLERKISTNEHSEFKNILIPFNNPKIISIFGITQLTAIIEPTKNGRTYSIILINGYKSEILECSKTKINDILYKHLKLKDYLPEPLFKKIVYIKDFDCNLKGIVFSEYSNNMWTIDDPLKLPITSKQKISGKIIIKEILSDILQ